MDLSITIPPPDARVWAVDLPRRRARDLLDDLTLLAEPPRVCGAIRADTVRLYVWSARWPDDTGLTLLLRSYGDVTTVAVWTLALLEQDAALATGSALRRLCGAAEVREAGRG